jgi:hypothetical protein
MMMALQLGHVGNGVMFTHDGATQFSPEAVVSQLMFDALQRGSDFKPN